MRYQRKITGIKDRPRLSIFRSNKHIYAQVIDDLKKQTLASANSLQTEKLAEKAKDKTQAAFMVGKILAEKANKKKVTKVVFDRGRYRYHGRVKQLAEGAREGGLIF